MYSFLLLKFEKKSGRNEILPGWQFDGQKQISFSLALLLFRIQYSGAEEFRAIEPHFALSKKRVRDYIGQLQK